MPRGRVVLQLDEKALEFRLLICIPFIILQGIERQTNLSASQLEAPPGFLPFRECKTFLFCFSSAFPKIDVPLAVMSRRRERGLTAAIIRKIKYGEQREMRK